MPLRVGLRVPASLGLGSGGAILSGVVEVTADELWGPVKAAPTVWVRAVPFEVGQVWPYAAGAGGGVLLIAGTVIWLRRRAAGAKEAVRYCRKCGAVLRSNAPFCPRCGAPR